MSQSVEVALQWIKSLLNKHQIPYQIVGGLAVKIYGGSREVADIDLYIPNTEVNKLLPEVNAFISKPLAHYQEAGWDLEYFQLVYQGQKIEIGLAPGTRIFDKKNRRWIALETDFSGSVLGVYRGIGVPVMPRQELIAYKAVLNREVDQIDIRELTSLDS